MSGIVKKTELRIHSISLVPISDEAIANAATKLGVTSDVVKERLKNPDGDLMDAFWKQGVYPVMVLKNTQSNGSDFCSLCQSSHSDPLACAVQSCVDGRGE